MNAVYTNEEILALYKSINVDQVPNFKYFKSLVLKHSNIFKTYNYQPVAYFKNKEHKGFNQGKLLIQKVCRYVSLFEQLKYTVKDSWSLIAGSVFFRG
jgi:hypothetical protein